MNSKEWILAHQKMSTWLPRTSYGLFHDFRVEIHYFYFTISYFYQVCFTWHHVIKDWWGWWWSQICRVSPFQVRSIWWPCGYALLWTHHRALQCSSQCTIFCFQLHSIESHKSVYIPVPFLQQEAADHHHSVKLWECCCSLVLT